MTAPLKKSLLFAFALVMTFSLLTPIAEARSHKAKHAHKHSHHRKGHGGKHHGKKKHSKSY